MDRKGRLEATRLRYLSPGSQARQKDPPPATGSAPMPSRSRDPRNRGGGPSLHLHYLVPARADRCPRDRRIQESLDRLEVGARLLGEVVDLLRLGDVVAPTGKFFVHRPAFVEDRLVRRELVESLAFELV